MSLKRWMLAATALSLAACGAPSGPSATPGALRPETGKALPDQAAFPVDRQVYPSHNTYRVLAVEELPIVGVTVDSQVSHLPKERLLDGDLSTQWVNGGYRNPTSWAAVELAANTAIASIGIKTGTSPAGTSYDVQVSADGASWKTVLANQTNSGWQLETKALPAGTSGQFVRIFWRNSPTHPQPHFAIFELLVNGEAGSTPTPTPTPTVPATPTPAPTATPSPAPAGTLTRVSPASVTASSSYGGLPPARSIDGDTSTQWASGGYREPEASLTFDFGTVRDFAEIRIKTGALPEGITFKIDVSRDGVTWEPASGRLTNRTWQMESQTVRGSGRHLKLRFFNSDTAPIARFSVFELEAYAGSGTSVTPAPSPSPTPPPSGGTNVQAWYPDWIAVATQSYYMDRSDGRTRLRFSTAIANIGAGHIQIIPEGPNGLAIQEILNGSNQVIYRQETTRPVYYEAHGHTHIEGIARYDLRRGSPTGPVLKTSVKTSFCVEDSYKYRPTNEVARYPDCTPTLMGVTRNYADLYTSNLPGQDFDVTGMSTGEYYLVVQIDPGQSFLDASRSNNLAWTKFYLDPPNGVANKLASYP